AQDQARKEFFGKNPDLETLFGSLSFCECEHCRSVYSPAAYLVDLLHWLDRHDDLKQDLDKANGPIHALLKRRPDLANLALTCQNTNTTLPYIDVVNEVLESFIYSRMDATKKWHEAPVDNKTLQARDTGDAKAEDLRAVPQYVIPDVYTLLAVAQAAFPMTLPFNRSLQVVRTYLDHLGTSRAEIMAAFQAGSPPLPSENDIVRERLGLSAALAGIITGIDSPGMKVWNYFGFDAESGFVDKIERVAEFLPRTGLSLEELVELLKTRFINPYIYYPTPPQGKAIITIRVGEKDPCDVTQMKLENLTWVEAPDSDQYRWVSRMHRFLRLWRVLGWTMKDLDRAIHAFGDQLDNTTLTRIEARRWLKKELQQPIESLLTCWGDVDTWGLDSLYVRLFLGKDLVPTGAEVSEKSAFALAPDGTKLDDQSQPLDDHLSAVFAALQLTVADYEAIKGVETISPSLTLQNLSLLCRYGVLARALDLRVRDVATLVRLVPDDHRPFKPADAPATYRFVRLVRTIQQSDFTVPLLNYLFRHEEEPTRHPAPTRVLTVTTLK